MVTIALLVMLWCLVTTPSRLEWDSKGIATGLANLIAWGHGGFEGAVEPNYFPVFQYLTGLPVALMSEPGSQRNVLRLWAFSSFFALVGTGWLLWQGGRRHASRPLAWLLVVILLSGALITYAKSTFNELPATLLTLCFTAAVIGNGGPVVSAGLFVAAALTKEIAPPLLVPFWLAGLWLRRADLGRSIVVRHATALAAAFTLSVLTHAAFNLLRFGSILNRFYLAEPHLIRPWDRRGENAVALWLAPSGGVVPFWPTIVGIVVVALVVALRQRQGAALAGSARIARLVPAAMVIATLGGLTVGLSGFFQPFGWWCWGPRLMLPWLPAALLVLVRAYPGSFNEAARLLLERRGPFAATLAFTCITAAPHVFMVIARPIAVHEFHLPDMQFPRGAPPDAPELHYMRLVYLAWLKYPPQLLVPFTHAPPLRPFIQAMAYLAAMCALLWRARTTLPRLPTSAPTAPLNT